MAMAALRQPKQLNNNAAPRNPYLLTLCLETTTTQKAFLANSKNKARLIDKLTTELQLAGVLVKHDPTDADHLIVSTALTLAQTERKPVVVVDGDAHISILFRCGHPYVVPYKSSAVVQQW